jgi:hypothetical protein
VAAPVGAKDGAGTIAIVNRSIGPDQDDRDPADKLYLHSLTYPAPGAFDMGTGAYRSPAALPSRWLVVSCDPEASNLAAGGFDFDLCALDPVTETVSRVGGAAGQADVESVLVFARDNHGVFKSRIDEANGRTQIDGKATDAVVQVHDFPLLSTLLFANTRTGRPIDERVGGFDVFEALPPDVGATGFGDLGDKVVEDDFGSVFVDYDNLGHVALADDGSTKFSVAGGHPILLRLTDDKRKPLTFSRDAPFTGEMMQREQMQFYPGERTTQGFKRELFDGMCGGCHGSVTGAELDVAVDIDVLTSASQTDAQNKSPVSLVR